MKNISEIDFGCTFGLVKMLAIVLAVILGYKFIYTEGPVYAQSMNERMEESYKTYVNSKADAAYNHRQQLSAYGMAKYGNYKVRAVQMAPDTALHQTIVKEFLTMVDVPQTSATKHWHFMFQIGDGPLDKMFYCSHNQVWLIRQETPDSKAKYSKTDYGYADCYYWSNDAVAWKLMPMPTKGPDDAQTMGDWLESQRPKDHETPKQAKASMAVIKAMLQDKDCRWAFFTATGNGASYSNRFKVWLGCKPDGSQERWDYATNKWIPFTPPKDEN